MRAVQRKFRTASFFHDIGMIHPTNIGRPAIPSPHPLDAEGFFEDWVMPTQKTSQLVIGINLSTIPLDVDISLPSVSIARTEDP